MDAWWEWVDCHPHPHTHAPTCTHTQHTHPTHTHIHTHTHNTHTHTHTHAPTHTQHTQHTYTHTHTQHTHTTHTHTQLVSDSGYLTCSTHHCWLLCLSTFLLLSVHKGGPKLFAASIVREGPHSSSTLSICIIIQHSDMSSKTSTLDNIFRQTQPTVVITRVLQPFVQSPLPLRHATHRIIVHLPDQITQ